MTCLLSWKWVLSYINPGPISRDRSQWLEKAPPRLWRLLAATFVVSIPNFWYIYAIVDLIKSHAPPGHAGWPVAVLCSAAFYRLLLVKSIRNGVKVWFLQLPVLILMALAILPVLKALGLQ
jgi:hypothetical protein